MTRFGRTTLGLLLLSLAVYFALPRLTPAGDDWQPIDPADLALKDNPKAPGADAMILYRDSMVEARTSPPTSSIIRIKIFTQAGAKRADVEIPFVKGFDDIRDIRARTIRPDGTVVNFGGKPFEKTVVKVSGLKYLAKTFTLPDVQPGCLIEYKYRDQYDSKPVHQQRDGRSKANSLLVWLVSPSSPDQSPARSSTTAPTICRPTSFRSANRMAGTRWKCMICPEWMTRRTCPR